MSVIELGSIDSDLGRNKLCLGNRAIVITAIQPQRVRVSAPVPYVKIVMWHGDLRLRKTRQWAEPLFQLLLLLALCIGLITLLVCTLGVLLSTPWMLPALCVIALAVLLSGGSVRPCRIFVKFSGFVVIVVCHVGSISSAPSAQQHAELRAVPKSHGMVCEDLQKVSSDEMTTSAWTWRAGAVSLVPGLLLFTAFYQGLLV
jgi:hypothetical protein